MLASKGYPGYYEKGHKVSGFELNQNYYVSGLKKENNQYVNSGGRVILAIGQGDNLAKAQQEAYKNVEKINSDNLFYRNDIGNKALK